MPLFSVIIPTYNRGELIYPTLNSVLAQTETDLELIIVDDGSTDATAEALQKYAARTNDHRINIIRRENGGTTAARNTGISHASGTYITLLDHDDLWFPWTLQTHRTVIERFDSPAFNGGSLVSQDSNNIDLTVVPRPPLNAIRYDDFLSASQDNVSFYPSTWAVRADSLKSIGGFFPYNLGYEDIDLMLRLGDSKGFVRILEPKLAVRGIHDLNLSSDRRIPWFVAGMDVVMERERSGQYPGGPGRSIQRRRFISLTTRPLSTACIRIGHLRTAWKLYRESFGWNVRIGRVKYLLALPVMILLAQVRRSLARSAR